MMEIDFDAAAVADPYGTYERMRSAPGLVRDSRQGFWVATRYEDVREGGLRTEDFSSRIVDVLIGASGLGAWFGWLTRELGPVDVLAVADAPEHRVHRKLTNRHFGRDAVAHTIDRARPVLRERLGSFIRAGGGDFAAQIASTLPVHTTLGLLGFPDADEQRMKRIVDTAVLLLSGVFPPERKLASIAAALELYSYSWRRLQRAKRSRHPASPLRDAIVAAIDDQSLTRREAASLLVQIVSAGIDSTSSLLSTAAHRLALDPELAQRLRSSPALIPIFIEECVRLESPFQGHFRVVRRPTTLGGTAMKTGDRLMLGWGSANRDPAAFQRPEQLDLDRDMHERRHLAFGHGAHLCVGAGLARALGRTMVETMLAETRHIQLAGQGPTWRPSAYLRTITALPLRVAPSPRPSALSKGRADSSTRAAGP